MTLISFSFLILWPSFFLLFSWKFSFKINSQIPLISSVFLMIFIISMKLLLFKESLQIFNIFFNFLPLFPYFHHKTLHSYYFTKLSLENCKRIIKETFPIPFVILNSECSQVLFSNKASKIFFKITKKEQMFNEINLITLKKSENYEEILKKDLISTILSIFEDEETPEFPKFDCFFTKKTDDFSPFSDKTFEVTLGKILWGETPAILLLIHDNSADKTISKLKELNNMKESLIETVSHDIRLPLNSLQGLLELAFERITDKKARKYIRTAKKSANQLLFMVNDYLDYSQIKNNRLNLQIKQQKLTETLEIVIDLIKFQCKQKGINFVLENSLQKKEEIISTDHRRLQQILLNLLGNSLKFTKNGYIKLILQSIVHENQKFIAFFIQDTGIGIKPENLSNLFKIFGKLQQENCEINSSGIGFGLAICKSLIKELNPSDPSGIKIQSIFGNGSEFSFKLPLNYPKTEENPHEFYNQMPLPSTNTKEKNIELLDKMTYTNPEENIIDEEIILEKAVYISKDFRNLSDIFLKYSSFNEALSYSKTIPSSKNLSLKNLSLKDLSFKDASLKGFTSKDFSSKDFASKDFASKDFASKDFSSKDFGSKRKVLIMDDDQNSIFLLSEYMERFGIDYEVAFDGVLALEKIKRINDLDLIIMDCYQQILNGFEVLKTLKRLMKENLIMKVPILALSASDSREECLKNGIEFYLAKPVMIRDMKRMLEEIFEGKIKK